MYFFNLFQILKVEKNSTLLDISRVCMCGKFILSTRSRSNCQKVECLIPFCGMNEIYHIG